MHSVARRILFSILLGNIGNGEDLCYPLQVLLFTQNKCMENVNTTFALWLLHDGDLFAVVPNAKMTVESIVLAYHVWTLIGIFPFDF